MQDTRRQPSLQRRDSHHRRLRSTTGKLTVLVEHAFLYLSDKTYPPECTKNEKRSIRCKAEKLVIINGELFYKKKEV